MYNFYSSKDGCMGDEKRERRCGDFEYGEDDHGYYDNKESKEDDNCNKGKEHNEEKGCVIINIYCDNCKKESKKDDGKDNGKNGCKDNYRDSGKENHCKDNYKDGCRDDCKDNNKKDNEHKEDKSCVIINIYCDKNK
ncbi:MAG: hypothetical protein K0S04_4137 [Herbinix sp.]|jgi:hypothetical protein|nr:hypothetical protein [Herbinix sp.]